MNARDQFEVIVSQHYEGLFRFAISLSRSESDARDLTQQTFYVWATKGHQLRDISKVKSWLYTTLHRMFLAGRQRRERLVHHELDECSEEIPVIPVDVVNKADSPAVLSALANVDEVYRAAVTLYYLEDSSYKEIAAVLDVPIGTVKSRIARGIAQLRDILAAGDVRESAGPRENIVPLCLAGECGSER